MPDQKEGRQKWFKNEEAVRPDVVCQHVNINVKTNFFTVIPQEVDARKSGKVEGGEVTCPHTFLVAFTGYQPILCNHKLFYNDQE